MLFSLNRFVIYGDSTVCINSACYTVELATTVQERQVGLMNRKKLGKNRGMLFVFNQSGKHAFWMKNTEIPLDIIWVNQQFEVVFIQAKTRPCKKMPCPIYRPSHKSRYVLELNSGEVDRNHVKIGDIVKINWVSMSYPAPNYKVVPL